jgi:nucleoid-associated protein YgaU
MNMGQLERYGLYVLCLVIFLILGVAIWGGDPQAAGTGKPSLVSELEQALQPIEEEPLPQIPAEDAMTLSRLLDVRPITDVDDSAQTVASPETRIPAEVVPPEAQIEAPVATQARYYVIQKGDNYSEISLRELGTSRRWEEIRDLNPGMPEGKLIPGERLLMPSSVPSRAVDTAAASGQQFSLYTVVKGDNPSRISVRRYGSEAFAQRILDLNPGMDPKKMMPGSLIRVPLRK